MDKYYMTKEESKYREGVGSFPTNDEVCNSCINRNKRKEKICWDCDAGSNFKSVTRSLKEIHQMIMVINTNLGNGNIDGSNDPQKVMQSMVFTEALKWVIKPYGSEEDLYNEFGFEYTELDAEDY